eukprot:gb/GEZN01009759.1/.p1 GENE.gb/GEZN01009759.1/~~gb/GEZN01009759.1/.p1  ORF type:complete len:333 (+),score=39.62 gb/GEZN01009759.1/:20-1018(+)
MTERLPFSLSGCQWSQTDALGRMKHFFMASDPRLCFWSDHDLEEAKKRLQGFKEGKRPPNMSDPELWRDRYAVESSYAKDGEKIPLPFRLSGYALGNLPITVGILTPNLGFGGIFFFQWANQTQNALLNHYNRPTLEPLPMDKMVPAYVMAVAGALGIAFGSPAALKRAAISDATRASLSRFVPFLAVGTANCLNTYFMRRHEIADGVEVFAYNRKNADTSVGGSKGEYLGKSQIAATSAIAQTCFSRLVLSGCMLITPQLVLPPIEKSSFFQQRPKLVLPLRIAFITACMFTFVPVSVGVMEQDVIIPSDKLEESFQKMRPGQLVTYNKGL